MEHMIKVFIYIHAFLGGLGLISGIGSIIVKKGSKPHKILGKLFSIGMLLSTLISLPISWMPDHENIFLFLIGLFTMYLVVSGNQILSFKSKQKTQAQIRDKLISGVMLVVSMIMILIGVYGLIKGNSSYLLFVFFGGFGLFLSLRDFRFYNNLKTKRHTWLMNHVGKMVGAFVASVTAFIVAGIGIGHIIAWISPTILGTAYIMYWGKKLNLKSS